jgi:hypothetical protein
MRPHLSDIPHHWSVIRCPSGLWQIPAAIKREKAGIITGYDRLSHFHASLLRSDIDRFMSAAHL